MEGIFTTQFQVSRPLKATSRDSDKIPMKVHPTVWALVAGLITATNLSAPCYGMDTTGFRKSPDIDDRREYSFADEMKLFDQPRGLLIALGHQATNDKFPFFCTPFKPLKAKFAKLGSDLEKAKSTASIFAGATSLPSPPGIASLNLAGVDACGGAKATLMGQIDDSIGKLQRQKEDLVAAYKDIYNEIDDAMKSLRAAAPKAADALNSDCSPTRNQTLSALSSVKNALWYMCSSVDKTIRKLKNSQEAISSKTCGSLAN